MFQDTLTVKTKGRGSRDITADVAELLSESGVDSGLCHLFCQHTSASLVICENADPDVHRDMEAFLSRLVPDGDPMFVHDAEGPDDMPAHVRSMLTQSGLTVPVSEGHLLLGTWQGLYLYEHRTAPHTRRIVVTAWGDAQKGGTSASS